MPETRKRRISIEQRIKDFDKTIKNLNFLGDKKEKYGYFAGSLSLEKYWDDLQEVFSKNGETIELKGIFELLDKNPQIYEPVLMQLYKLVEKIKLWHLHQGQTKSSSYNEKRYTAKNAAFRLSELIRELNNWDDYVFSGNGEEAPLDISRNHYEPAAKFILSTSAALFATIPTLSSPDIKAHTTRMALALLDKSASHAGYLRQLLTERAAKTGAKEDVGEDAFYEALTQLIGSWSGEQRAAITKQLGDLMGIRIESEQNINLITPVTQEMADMAVLLLNAIRQHNQNDVDFADSKAKDVDEKVLLKKRVIAARGAELGTEPLLAMVQHLGKTAENGQFDEEVAQQLFQAMMFDAQLANPTILLRIIETFAHPKLREALQKAYSRRSTEVAMTEMDDVLMYLLTGTMTSGLPHAAYSLEENNLQWAADNLTAGGYASKLADFIRTMSKFGLHTLNGLNPVPQMFVYVPPKELSGKAQKFDTKNLQKAINTSGIPPNKSKKYQNSIMIL